MNRDLQAILAYDNPWLGDAGALSGWLESHLPPTYLPRHVATTAADLWRNSDRAHLVVGPRQAGKSTTIWAHLTQLDRPVLFIDCEQTLVQEWCRSAPLFLGELEGVLERPTTLFFEEAQHLENAGLFLKGLVDRKVGAPILVTGSSSFHLGARVRESLAGRATRIRLLPFSLTEVCADVPERPAVAQERAVLSRFERHVRFGGYPEAWLAEKPEDVLTGLAEAVILRDATDLFRIARPDAFRKLLRLAAAQVGNLVNLSEWASVLGISRDTVASYLEILESSHVVTRIPPFVGGKRSELTRAGKIFFVDQGLRNRLVHEFRPPGERADGGAALESWVFTELLKAAPADTGVHFWRSTSKAEVDFVLDLPGSLVGVEVKAGRFGRQTIPRSARSFIDAYRPELFFIVANDGAGSKRIGGTEVRWIPPHHITDAIVGFR
jgi:predicted AAA+ superfamily ATPase